MKLEFSFRDVPKEKFKRRKSIKLNENTVIYGNNGRGKTRILKTIDSIYKIVNLNFESRLVSLIEEVNLDNLRIDGIDYSELFDDRKFNRNKNFYKFLDHIEFALRDFLLSLKKISNLSFMFHEIFNKYIENLGVYVDKRTNSRLTSFARFERIVRESQISLRKIRNEFSHSQNFYVSDNSVELLNEFQNAISINEYLLRSLEDFRYTQLDSEVDKIRNIKKEMAKMFRETDCLYISPSSNLETISSLIENHIEKCIYDYGKILFESEYTTKSEDRIKDYIAEINKKVNELNKLLISGYGGLKVNIKDRKVSFQKEQEGEFNDLKREQLSSGERRILKLFLTIAFTKAKLYLIDEPEVSLSLNFQSKLVNDLLSLAESEDKKLIIATHAPFIFEDCESRGFEKLEL